MTATFLPPMSDEARNLGAPNGGYRVERVNSGGAAELGGLKEGDVIIEISGVPVTGSAGEFDGQPGIVLPMRAVRNREQTGLSVTLQPVPRQRVILRMAPPVKSSNLLSRYSNVGARI